MSDLSPREVGKIVRAGADKAIDLLQQPKHTPATVIEVTPSEDANAPEARVHFDNAPAEQTDFVQIQVGGLQAGDRVWVAHEPPHGMSVVGKMGGSGGGGSGGSVWCTTDDWSSPGGGGGG